LIQHCWVKCFNVRVLGRDLNGLFQRRYFHGFDDCFGVAVFFFNDSLDPLHSIHSAIGKMKPTKVCFRKCLLRTHIYILYHDRILAISKVKVNFWNCQCLCGQRLACKNFILILRHLVKKVHAKSTKY
jgi:hypothetical protein